MAGILDDFGEIDDDLVASGLCESDGKTLPGLLIEADMVRAAAREPLFGHGRILRLKRNITPGVYPKMRKIRPDELWLWVLDEGCSGRATTERKCACGCRNEFASIDSHVTSLYGLNEKTLALYQKLAQF